ncbi:efflux transporter outer membrane subunit [Ideonella margarita]|uniref:Efflux transporter outer membrane subunit n=1 Tax=Ideonella margarita TaxID=2984191 RepID=A0ABU9C8T5_9BURK
MNMLNLHNSASAPGGVRLACLLALVGGLALGLSGCASTGDAPTALTMKAPADAGLAPTDTGVVAARWWLALGDPRLNALVDQALANQPSLAVAQARVQRAQALAGLTDAVSGPQVGLQVDVARQRYTANGLVPKPVAGSVYDSGTLQVGASWSPDFFGQHAAELAAALGQVKAAQVEASGAAQWLAAQVARSYVGLARLQAQREVSEAALAQRQAMLALTRQRVAAGLDTQVELTQADGALPDTRNQLAQLDEQITLARHQLATLTGQAPGALATLSPTLAGLTLPAVPEQVGADLLGRRPDVVAARWRVEAAQQDVAVARAQFYPNVNLTAFVGLNALGLDNVLQGSSRQMGVAPALRLPLFDGGRLRAQWQGRQAERDVAVAQYNGLVLDAAREAADSLSTLHSLQLQQREQAAALASAERAHELARQRYAAGLGNYLIVLSTESPLLAQRRLAADLQARQLDARIALMKALGGGWSDS